MAHVSDTAFSEGKRSPARSGEAASARAADTTEAIPIRTSEDLADAVSRLLGEAAAPVLPASPPPALVTRPARRTRIPGLVARSTGLQLSERKLWQAVADAAIIGTGLLLIMLNSVREYDSAAILFSLICIALIWLFFARTFDSYDIRVLQSIPRNVYVAAQTYLMVGGVYVLFALFAGGILPAIRFRLSELFFALLLILPLMGARALYTLLLIRAPLRRHVVVIGANETGQEMVDTLDQYGGAAYQFLGYFDDKLDMVASPLRGPAPTVFPTASLLTLHDEVGIDQLVLATPDRSPRLLQTISLCHERGIQITPMFALYQDLTGRVPVEHLGHDWFVALPAHRKGTPYLFIKRALDMTMSLTLMLLTLPLWPLIALAIRLDSPGPIFFRQPRVGCGGRLFKILKFRSMTADAEARTGAVWAQAADKRITRVGRFLRKSRLDELPQLWNVVIGEMSFVGPRPERPEFDEKLEQAIPFYRARRAVRPGVTGWAQVRYGYGNTMFDALRKVEYDLYYIKNESLYLDLVIILRTLAVVLKLGGT